MSVRISNEQLVPCTCEGVTEGGRSVALSTLPIWETSDPTIVALTPSDDRLSCIVDSLGVVGTCVITVTSTNALGDVISGTLDVEVYEAVATRIVITAGTPELG